jgi:hypothetical protein
MLTDQFDLTRFVIYARRGEYPVIEREFGVSKGYILNYYLRSLVETNVFGSVFSNRTQRELAWGFYDQFLTKMVFNTILMLLNQISAMSSILIMEIQPSKTSSQLIFRM